jgi:uncharacterized membrane protein
MEMIKYIFTALLLIPLLFAGDKSASDFRNLTPDFREYLISVESGIVNAEQWNSINPVSVATSEYTSPTNYYVNFRIVDSTGRQMQWFNESISGFSVSTSALTTTQDFTALILSDTVTFKAGSAGVGFTVTGEVSIGSLITVSAPLYSSGVATIAATASRVVTFTE